MNTSNENKHKSAYSGDRPIRGKGKIALEINQELCELDKIYEDYEIISIRKNRFFTWFGKKRQLYRMIIGKDGIGSELELGLRDSERLAYYTNMFYDNTPDKIGLPKVVSFAWTKRETKRGTPYLTLHIKWNNYSDVTCHECGK